MTTPPDLDWTGIDAATPPNGTLPTQRRRTIIDAADLVHAARSERSRLHRLAVNAAHHRQTVSRALADADARIYRCPGCGDWRYDSETRRYPGSALRCTACRTRRPRRTT